LGKLVVKVLFCGRNACVKERGHRASGLTIKVKSRALDVQMQETTLADIEWVGSRVSARVCPSGPTQERASLHWRTLNGRCRFL
jgi:hypothetical protein